MKIKVNNPCIVCGILQSNTVYENVYPQHNYPGIFAIRKCRGCGLWFNSPRLPHNEIRALYDKNYYFFNRTDKDEFKRMVDLYCRSVRMVDRLVDERRVLEIGSAKGYLLAALQGLGWTVQGVELSKDAARYALRRFKVPTFTGTLEEYIDTHTSEQFPLVLALDVLEHVTDPRRFLKSITDVVAPNGYLIIDTPNGAAADIITRKSNWKGFNPYHIFVFSKHNLAMLLVDYGFGVDKILAYNNGGHASTAGSEQRTGMFKPFIKRTLRRLGILQSIQRPYLRLRQAMELLLLKDEYLNRAVENMRLTAMPYAFDPNVESLSGDNLVVIARKK
jgi:2-polyprenyl-3-methyl-5-hydroxy-6-metoxy-1,4-benzoquinol methylase